MIDDGNIPKIKSPAHPQFSKPNLNISPLNNTAVLKELVHENIRTKNSSAKRATESNESHGKKPVSQALFRQASSGKLTGNKQKPNLTGAENKPMTPLESASKVSSTRSFLGYGELKSPKGFVSDKVKSKSLNKDVR